VTTEELAVVPRDWENVSPAEVIERVVINGDLQALSPDQRVAYYARVCESLGLNPYTRPFDYIRLNNKLTLYAKRDATDQIRRNLRISVTGLDPAAPIEGLYGLIAHVRTPDGREDTGTAYVSIRGLQAENLANALMKCETKAKRRATLSLAGLGIIDESEIASIPDGEIVAVDDAGVIKAGPTTVSEVIAARVAALDQSEYDPSQAGGAFRADGSHVASPPTQAEPVVETGESDAPEAVAVEELTEPDATSDADYASVEDETDGLAGPETVPFSGNHAVSVQPDGVVVDPVVVVPYVREGTVPEPRSMDLNAFAARVAANGDVVPRDEMRQIAATMFPEATGFRMLSDEQRGAIADAVDALVAERKAAENATDDDAEEEAEPTEAETLEVESLANGAAVEDRCLAPSPFSENRCDSTPGHAGPHRFGDNESW
jgi:hypothetical protein